MKDIAIAFIEHGLWPLVLTALLFWLFCNYKNIISTLGELNFKKGDFSLSIKTKASKVDAIALYGKLPSLNSQQLHLFLIVGGEEGEKTTYKPVYPIEPAFEKLSKLGLIEYEQSDAGVIFKNTTDGTKLHKIIMDEVYQKLVLD